MVAGGGRRRGVVVARGAGPWWLGGDGARPWRHGGTGHGVAVAQRAGGEFLWSPARSGPLFLLDGGSDHI